MEVTVPSIDVTFVSTVADWASIQGDVNSKFNGELNKLLSMSTIFAVIVLVPPAAREEILKSKLPSVKPSPEPFPKRICGGSTAMFIASINSLIPFVIVAVMVVAPVCTLASTSTLATPCALVRTKPVGGLKSTPVLTNSTISFANRLPSVAYPHLTLHKI